MTHRIGLALALASCSNPVPPPAPSSNPPATVAVAPVTSPASAPPKASEPLPECARAVRHLGLEGSTPEQVEARFGAPVTRESFRAIERQGEFYAALENLYPSIDPKNHDVPLQEWTWKSGACTLTVWFHSPAGTWVVIDDVYWHEQIDF